MSHLPDGASFEEQVQECFLAFRGQGLMLSAIDAELLSTWARACVPLEVIARGLKKAAERQGRDARPGDPGLKSLKSCRREVEAEIRRYQTSRVGQGVREGGNDEPLPGEAEALADRLAAARPELSAALAKLPFLHRADEARVVAAVLRGLDGPTRWAILREARAQAPRLEAASPRALRLARRFQLASALRRHLGLGDFW
jgi:hypothetical protein